jgi:hypothetical protein
MKPSVVAPLGLLGILTFVAAAAHAQGTPSPAASGLNPAALAAGLAELSFWVVLLATLVAGAVGGVVYELLILQGNIELSHKPTAEEITEKYPYGIVQYMYDLGIWARVIIGALAAVAALFVLSPSSTFGLLATSIIAGSAGTSVFRSMQDRLSAVIAQKTATDTKAKADKQAAKTDEAMKAFSDLKKKLVEGSTSPHGTRALTFVHEKAVSLDLEDLDKVERLLSEAKGVHGGD